MPESSESVAVIVMHESGHRYYTWSYPRDVPMRVSARFAAAVTRRYGNVVWAIKIPEAIRQTIVKDSDWNLFSPDSPGVEVLYRSPVGAV